MDSGKQNVTSPRPKPNNSWVCGNFEMGASCPKGPSEDGKCCHAISKANGESPEELASELPCQPRKSPRFSRQDIAINFAILSAGILLLCMTAPQREELYVPGGLSHAHAQILDNALVSERCSLCHPNSHPDAAPGLLQDQLCMTCHTAHIPDATRRSPHDLTMEELRTIRFTPNEQQKTMLMSATDETFCAQCHIEHRGGEHDLKAMADKRCQACHREQFESFAIGHPQFSDYPNIGERRFAFDHRAHAGEYYAKKNEEFDCRSCHLDASQAGVVGSVFRSVGFEKACGSCHTESMRSEFTNGWAFLQLPCLPEELVKSGPSDLADWPLSAQFGFDGQVSFAARLLLAGEPTLPESMRHLPSDGQISKTADEHLEQTASGIAVAYRKVVREIANGGQAAWRKRLESSLTQILARDLNEHELDLVRQVSVGLPPDLFRQIEQHWFVGNEQLTQDSSDLPIPALSDQREQNVFRFVSTTLGAQDDLLGEDDADDDLLLGGWDDDPPETKPSKATKLVKLNAAIHLEEGGWYLDDQFLALRYVPRGHSDPFLSAWGELITIVERNRPNSAAEDTRHPWSKEDLNLKNAIPGSCLECHQLGEGTTSQASAGELWANWRSEKRPANLRQFTKFDHSPHLSLPAVNDCQYCHRFDTDSKAADQSFASLKALMENMQPDDNYRSRLVAMQGKIQNYLGCEFDSIEKAQCVACHRPDGAGDSCTQCHHYHVGTEGFLWSQPMRRAQQK